MRLYKYLAALLLLAAGCGPQAATKPPLPAAKPAPAPAGDGFSWRTCALSSENFAFAIDSCNCDDMHAASDTFTIDLSPADGGEIQGRLLKITNPACDSSYVVLRQHQNRYYVSSMGPDPVLTDWLLYTSPVDTIRFDSRRRGFRIDSIPEAEQRRFPRFNTLAFYRAYQRAVGENLRSNAVPGNAKSALYEEAQAARAHVRELPAGAELHRILLTLKKGRSVKQVLVFNYGHFG